MKGGSQYISYPSPKTKNSCCPSPGNLSSMHVCIINPPKQAPKQSIESISPNSSPNGGGIVILGMLFNYW